ncbi:MAG TPA: CPBP family intramembrane glutamic endopeptidase [Hyphomicrobiaceae bacterium]
MPAIAVVAVVEGLRLAGRRILVANAGMDGPPALALSQALSVVLIVAASGLLGGRPRDVLALHAPVAGWRVYAAAVVAMALLRLLASFIVYALYVAVALSAGSFDPVADWQRDQGLLQAVGLVPLLGVMAVGAPLSEELIYRGFLLSALARTRLGFWGAALVATVAWTALHDYSAFGVASVFMTGLVLSWLLWRTGSLRVVIFCHVLNNALALVAHRLITLPL